MAQPTASKAWVASVAGYLYGLTNRDGRDILARHWHPALPQVGGATHQHVYSAILNDAFLALGARHLPTGPVALEDVIQTRIGEVLLLAPPSNRATGDHDLRTARRRTIRLGLDIGRENGVVRARTVHGDVQARNERLDVRMTREDKDLMKQAAALEGVPTTQFVTGALRRAAEQTNRDRMVIKLSQRDSRMLAELLLSPPEPSEHMKSTAEEYRKHGRTC